MQQQMDLTLGWTSALAGIMLDQKAKMCKLDHLKQYEFS